MIAREAENKCIGNAIEYNVLHNSPIGSADCRAIIPQIGPIGIGGAGVNTSAQRMGDRVKPKSLVVKGTVSLSLDSATTQRDIYVRVLILAQKDIKNGGQVNAGAVDTAHLLRTGFVVAAQNQVAFQGYTMDHQYQVNKDKFRVYMDKRIKLTPAAATGIESNARYSATWTYRFKQLPASLTWDEGSGDWANNFAPFLCLGYSYTDGTGPDLVTTKVVSNAYSRFEFEDA